MCKMVTEHFAGTNVSDKKDGGTIINWQLHTLSATPVQVSQFGYEVQTDKCYVLTGTVKEDPTGRWEPGFHMRSSLIVAMDLDKGIIETQNTVYKVEGEQGGDIFPDIGDGAMGIFY